MIRLANMKDLTALTTMLMELAKEIAPEHCSDDELVYRTAIMEHINSDRDSIYIAKGGFFIVRDDTDNITPTLHRFIGLKVYIRPEHRKTSLLARFYDRLFKDFPNGDILGLTEIDSEHIKVLDKRHDLIAKVYRLRRS